MKNIDPSEINIINYITGEMNAEEFKQFESQLEENHLLRSQVEELKNAQLQLSNWKNSDIVIPDIELSVQDEIPLHVENNVGSPGGGKNIRFSIPQWAKYAAAFIGFAVLLQITGLKINQEGNTLMLSFGEPAVSNVNSSDVNAIVAKALDSYANSMNSDLADFKNQVNTDLGQLNTTVDGMAISNQKSIDQLKGHINRNLDQQYVSLSSMITDNENHQRQEMEDSFTGLVEYLDNNRTNDQLRIQNAFSDIATAINNQHYQTSALLTSISSEDAGLKSY